MNGSGKRRFPLSATVAALVAVLATPARAREPAFVNGVRVDGAAPGEWTHDWDAAVAGAKESGKPLFVNFTGSDWCGWCKLLKRQVFSQPEWCAWASNHVFLVHLDFPKDKALVPEKYRERNRELAGHYKVGGYPTCYLLDPATLEPVGRFGASRNANAPDFVEKVSAAMSGAKSDKPAREGSIHRTVQRSTVTTNDFKAVLTGIAVVEDKYRLRPDKAVFVPPETKVEVPYGKTVLFRVEYDFPKGCGARVWTRDGICTDGMRHSWFFGSNPSGFFKGKGTAYGFLLLLGRGKECRMRELLLNTGVDDDVDISPRTWTIATVPIDIEFLEMSRGADTAPPRASPAFLTHIEDGVLKSVQLNRAEAFTVPDGVVTIGDGVFEGNRDLREIILPEGVRKIGDRTFFEASRLSHIVLPASLEEIGRLAFAFCGNLERIEVHPGNGRYCVTNSLLVDRKTKTIIRAFGPMENVSFPEDVTGIGVQAFSSMPRLVSVEIPDSIQRIAPSSFGQCPMLKEIRMPKSMAANACGSNIAPYCPKLETLDMPEGIREFHLTYMGCRSIRNPVLPKSLRSVKSQSFDGCYALEELVFPEGVQRFFGSSVVAHCANLKRIFLPSTVEEIRDGRVFHQNPKLETIDVVPANPWFQSIDGVLFDKGATRLVQCPGGRKGVYEIPPSVKTVDPHAFDGCAGLAEIRVPAGVSTHAASFSGCPARIVRVP